VIDTVLGISLLAWLAILVIVIAAGSLLIYTVLQDDVDAPRDARGRFVEHTLLNRILNLIRGR
jgi:hypothetical protein